MLPGGEEDSELSNLYLLVSKVTRHSSQSVTEKHHDPPLLPQTMVAIHQDKAEPEELVRLGDEW